ncbi:MAG: hypothetical protein PSV35_06290 [bacterium]|nr:hypothetical protein [bacterium]
MKKKLGIYTPISIFLLLLMHQVNANIGQIKQPPLPSFILPISLQFPVKALDSTFYSYSQRIMLAKQYINKNMGKEALVIIKPLLTNSAQFDPLLLAAQSFAEQNNPVQALSFYKRAMSVARTHDEQTVAYMGINKMETWIDEETAVDPNKKLSNGPHSHQFQAEESTFFSYSARLDLAKKYINENKGKEAWAVVKPLMYSAEKFNLLILAGQSFAEQNNPKQALVYFNQAQNIASTTAEINTANSHVAKIEQWLNDANPSTGYFSTPLSYSQHIKKAKQYINNNKGKKALQHLQFLPINYEVLLLKAQGLAEENQPLEALAYYSLAKSMAKTIQEKKIAVLGIAKMVNWLKQNYAKHPIKTSATACDKLAQQGDEALSYSQRILLINKYLNEEKGEHALELLKPLLNAKPNFEVVKLAAEAYTQKDRPREALEYYELALKLAHNHHEQLIARLAIAKMQFWLASYVHSLHTYEDILKSSLNSQSMELAKAGVVKSLAYMNRPIAAYKAIPSDLVYKTPAMVVAAAQATLWADQSDLTKQILAKNQDVIKKITLHSALDKDLQDVTWQMDLNTTPNQMSPSVFYSSDSDHFSVLLSTLNYSHYWSQSFQSAMGLKEINYKQPALHLSAKGFYAEQVWRPTRQLIFNAKINPMDYQLWRPFLWHTGLSYRPNDFINGQFIALEEVVETFPAFNHHITDNQYAANLSLKPLPYLQFDGSLSKLNISDTNHRNGYYLSAAALISPAYGISLILQERGFTDKFVSPYYFSPNRYVSDTLILRLGSKLGAVWHYYIDGGLGNQLIKITGTPSGRSPTQQWGCGINGPITSNLIVNAYYAMTNQASSFLNSPNYVYQYGAVSLTFLL